MKKSRLVTAALLLALGCRQGGGTRASAGSEWDVFKNGQKVEEIKNAPGTVSAMAPPPRVGEKAAPLPQTYVSGTIFSVSELETLERLRGQAKDFDGFVSLLRKNGYDVRPGSGMP